MQRRHRPARGWERPTADMIASRVPPRETPPVFNFTPGERKLLARWLERQIADLEFRMQEMGALSTRTTEIQIKHWRNQLKYWKHARKFCKWLLCELESGPTGKWD